MPVSLQLTDYLEKIYIFSTYRESISNYGNVLDLVTKNELIFILSEKKLEIYSANNFSVLLYEEKFKE